MSQTLFLFSSPSTRKKKSPFFFLWFRCKMFVYSKCFVKSVFHWVLLLNKWFWSMHRVVDIFEKWFCILHCCMRKKNPVEGKKLFKMFHRQLVFFLVIDFIFMKNWWNSIKCWEKNIEINHQWNVDNICCSPFLTFKAKKKSDFISILQRIFFNFTIDKCIFFSFC